MAATGQQQTTASIRQFPGPASGRPFGSSEADSLSLCLEFLTRYFGDPRPAAAIAGDLPHVDGKLTLGGFLQAADRVHLATQIVAVRINAIPALALPAILLLRDGGACLLVKCTGGMATIVGPMFSDGVRTIELAQLELSYAGRAVYVRPRFQFEAATDLLDLPPTRSWLWQTLRQDWGIFLQAALATAMVNLFALGLPFFTSLVFDRVVPHRALDTLHVLTLGASVLVAFDFLIRSMRAHFLDVSGKRADVILSSRVLQHILSLKLGSQRSAGNLANTLREFDTVREFFTSATLATVGDVPFAILFVVIIALMAGPLALIPVAAFVLLMVMSFLVVAPLDRLVQQNYQLAGNRHGLLFEILSGLETIKAVRAEQWAQRLWEGYSGQGAMLGYRTRTLSQFMTHLTTAVYYLCPIATLLFGVHMLKDDSLSIGSLFAVVMLNSRVLAPLGQITGLLSRLRHTMASLRAVDRIMRLPTERSAERNLLYPTHFKGALEFREVNFTYPGRDSEALANINFAIRPGEKVAIVGRTGSGKSTLARLMLNLYEPGKGSVLADNVDVRQIDPHALRRAIGYVPQETTLFSGTIRENISIGAPWADAEAILGAARTAGLDFFTAESAEGLDRRVGEGGEGLSGGQRQAICIARALLLDPRIVLLDEPTSMMDQVGERALKEKLAQFVANRTLVLITHRASLLSLVERVIVVERGRIAADGPRDQVLKHLRDVASAVGQ